MNCKLLIVLLLLSSSPLMAQDSIEPSKEKITPSFAEKTPEVQNSNMEPLDESVRLNQKEKISTVFRDLVVVQRKAKDKAQHILFSPTMNLDFSDGPVTMYGLNLNFGYAISDFWEVYLNYVPLFITNERDLLKKVDEIVKPYVGAPLAIKYSKPVSQLGVNVFWAPAYGKDSWGPYSIVRSDTFFKFGVAQITYDVNAGMRYDLQLGKTFFISQWWNLRVSAGLNSVETYLASVKGTSTIAVMEAGLVYYF